MLDIIAEIQETYHVNPYIFVLIFAASIPLYWYSVFRIVKAIRAKDRTTTLSWIIANIIIYIAPYTYVFVVGRNIPWWFYFALVAIIILSLSGLAKNIRKRVKEKRISLFWDIRSLFYDEAVRFIPYHDLLHDIINKAGLRPGHYVLDAGCGTGILERLMASQYKVKIEACDFSSGMLRQAQKRCEKLPNVNFSCINLDETLPYQDNTFNSIVCNNVIYAVMSPRSSIREFFRVLKPSGKLILATPRPDFSGLRLMQEHFRGLKGVKKLSIILIFFFFLFGVLPFEIIISFKEKRGIYHRFTKEALEKLLTSCGFKNIEISYSYAGQNFLVCAIK